MNVEEATLVWEAVGAIGSIAGAAVSAGAAVFAVRLAQQERRDRLVERADRIAAEARLEQMRAEKEAHQARRVRVVVRPVRWVEDRIVLIRDEGEGPGPMQWAVAVHNDSDRPIRRVRIEVHPEGRPDLLDTLEVEGVIARDTYAERWSRTRRPEVQADTVPAFRVFFTDEDARRWVLDQAGVLQRLA